MTVFGRPLVFPDFTFVSFISIFFYSFFSEILHSATHAVRLRKCRWVRLSHGMLGCVSVAGWRVFNVFKPLK